ncbi:hypothetical protein B0T11DRAFT_290877 [Plectosphaerella cucumerina]|uniref:Uncharacterized protein n=1 Tax=Plectosphaerella cucumerina TaxID=40658 RepID=A0A8K0T4P1_9PEZI|nr:hypothetical protein B0T11DRAFT_290877 [Plectosphaerella cucumerina]
MSPVAVSLFCAGMLVESWYSDGLRRVSSNGVYVQGDTEACPLWRMCFFYSRKGRVSGDRLVEDNNAALRLHKRPPPPQPRDDDASRMNGIRHVS